MFNYFRVSQHFDLFNMSSNNNNNIILNKNGIIKQFKLSLIAKART